MKSPIVGIQFKKYTRWQFQPYPHPIHLKRHVSLVTCGVVC